MSENSRDRIAERLELFASLAWLFMDFCWMEQRATPALVFAVPTAACSLAAILFVRADFTARAVTGATAAWAIMNALWMLSDLGIYEARLIARGCFGFGLVLLIAALAVSGPRPVVAELTRAFRRMRARRPD
jgi:hypothetical protein